MVGADDKDGYNERSDNRISPGELDGIHRQFRQQLKGRSKSSEGDGCLNEIRKEASEATDDENPQDNSGPSGRRV